MKVRSSITLSKLAYITYLYSWSIDVSTQRDTDITAAPTLVTTNSWLILLSNVFEVASLGEAFNAVKICFAVN